MSLPKFVLSPIPTAMAVDLERLCPATDRYRIFAEQVYPLLAKARAVLEKEAYCSNNGRVAIEPGLLLGVSLLQYLDRVPDRQAVELMRYHWGWNLALHRHLQEPGFDRSVFSYIREGLPDNQRGGLFLR